MNIFTLLGAALLISGFCSAQSDQPQLTIPLVLIGLLGTTYGLGKRP